MQVDDSREWARDHFGGLELGDARRTARVVEMAHEAAKRPGGRVLDVYRTSAERQGAYDFLENPAIKGEAMVEGIGLAVASDSKSLPYVLVSVDGSSLNIVDRKGSKGFGIVGNVSKSGRGLKIVTAYALHPDGTPIGVLDQEWWLRGTIRKDQAWRRGRTTEQKETRYFNQAIIQSSRRLEERATGTRAWFLLDRENDRRATIDLVRAMDRHWFTIRSNWNRRILNRVERAGPLHHRRIFREAKRRRFVEDALRCSDVKGHIHLDVPMRPGRPRRRATLSVRVIAPHVWLNSQKGPSAAAQMTLVEAREVHAPRGQEPLKWRLWTNYPVSAFEDAKLVVDNYAMRWRIEDFHKTWKTGACNVESCQLRSAEAAIKWATLMASVAARIERLKHRSRTEPSLPASSELTEYEIQSLIFFKKKYKKRTETISDDMPTLSQAVTWLAEIGGYMGPRVAGGPPGSITIRRGLEHIRPGALIFESIAVEPRKKKR